MSSSDSVPPPQAIRFKDVFGVFVTGPDDVEFRTGSTSGRSFVVSDAERRGLMGSIVERILSPQLGRARPWNDAEKELLGELIPQLRQSGILEADSGESAAWDADAGLPSTSLLRTPLAECHVAIVGHGVLGEAVRRIMRDAPCKRITTIASSSVAETVGVRSSEPLVARPAGEPEWVAAIEDQDWVIAAQDCFEPEELAALNKAALRVGVPWSLVCFDGYEGWVGPTFVPGQSACFNCFRRRLFAGAAEPKHVFADPGVKVHRLPAPWSIGFESSAWVSLIASMFAMDVIAVMKGNGFTVNHVLIVHRLNLTFQRESILRLPRCQECSPRRGAPQANPFSHILAARGLHGRAGSNGTASL